MVHKSVKLNSFPGSSITAKRRQPRQRLTAITAFLRYLGNRWVAAYAHTLCPTCTQRHRCVDIHTDVGEWGGGNKDKSINRKMRERKNSVHGVGHYNKSYQKPVYLHITVGNYPENPGKNMRVQFFCNIWQLLHAFSLNKNRDSLGLTSPPFSCILAVRTSSKKLVFESNTGETQI